MLWGGRQSRGGGTEPTHSQTPRVWARWTVLVQQRNLSIDSCKNQRGGLWEQVLLPRVSFCANWSSFGTALMSANCLWPS